MIHPIDTHFKQTSFVVKCICTKIVGCTCIASGLTLCFQGLEHLVPVYLCSPFVDPSDSSTLVVVFTWMTSVTQIVCAAVIILIYGLLIRDLEASQKLVQQATSKKQSNTPLFVQIFLIILSNLICWISCSVIFLTSLLLKHYPVTMTTWATAGLMPINSLTNPTMFIVSALRKIFHK